MNYSISISETANLAIQKIFEYYEKHESLRRAIKVCDSIINKIENIGNFPLAYKVYENVGKTKLDLRRATVHNTFIIVFRIIGNEIKIVNIYHLARNPSKFKL